MKRLLVLVLFVVVGVGCNEVSPIITLQAQTFPFTVHAELSPPPASNQVVNGTVTWDTGTPVSFPPTVDTTCNCVKTPTFSVPDNKTHVASVTWTNAWGTSPATALSFQVVVPGSPQGTVKGGS